MKSDPYLFIAVVGTVILAIYLIIKNKYPYDGDEDDFP
jgi:hypothetical protein